VGPSSLSYPFPSGIFTTQKNSENIAGLKLSPKLQKSIATSLPLFGRRDIRKPTTENPNY
jgi:hypothetical protein